MLFMAEGLYDRVVLFRIIYASMDKKDRHVLWTKLEAMSETITDLWISTVIVTGHKKWVVSLMIQLQQSFEMQYIAPDLLTCNIQVSFYHCETNKQGFLEFMKDYICVFITLQHKIPLVDIMNIQIYFFSDHYSLLIKSIS